MTIVEIPTLSRSLATQLMSTDRTPARDQAGISKANDLVIVLIPLDRMLMVILGTALLQELEIQPSSTVQIVMAMLSVRPVTNMAATSHSPN